MEEGSLRKKTVSGIVWSSVEQLSVQGVQFVVMLLIARILEPKDFGLVGMLAIFIALSQTFIDSGFSQALIRKQDRTEVDTCTVFFFNLIVSVIIYLVLFLIAPYVSLFYKEPQLTFLMRVLCIVVVLNSFSVVQRAVYTSKLDFKTQARCSLIAAIISGIVGISCAIKGAGVWSLVWQQLTNAGVASLLLWSFSKWYPRLVFSWSSFKQLFSFGSNLLISGIIDTIYTNIYPIIIGKAFSATSLGYYTQADKFTKLPSSNFTTILLRVTYPVFCKKQDDNNSLEIAYRKFIRLSAFIVFPAMCILAGVSGPLIEVLLGARWENASQLIIPLCFAMMWWPIHAINLNILKVKGRSDLFLKLEIIKKVLGVIVIIVSIPFGLIVLCYSSIFTSVVSLAINSYYTKRFINVGFMNQLYDISGTLIMSFIAFVASYLVAYYVGNNICGLLFSSIIGCVTFLGAAFLMKFKEIEYLKEFVRNE